MQCMSAHSLEPSMRDWCHDFSSWFFFVLPWNCFVFFPAVRYRLPVSIKQVQLGSKQVWVVVGERWSKYSLPQRCAVSCCRHGIRVKQTVLFASGDVGIYLMLWRNKKKPKDITLPFFITFIVQFVYLGTARDSTTNKKTTSQPTQPNKKVKQEDISILWLSAKASWKKQDKVSENATCIVRTNKANVRQYVDNTWQQHQPSSSTNPRTDTKIVKNKAASTHRQYVHCEKFTAAKHRPPTPSQLNTPPPPPPPDTLPILNSHLHIYINLQHKCHNP